MGVEQNITIDDSGVSFSPSAICDNFSMKCHIAWDWRPSSATGSAQIRAMTLDTNPLALFLLSKASSFYALAATPLPATPFLPSVVSISDGSCLVFFSEAKMNLISYVHFDAATVVHTLSSLPSPPVHFTRILSRLHSPLHSATPTLNVFYPLFPSLPEDALHERSGI